MFVHVDLHNWWYGSSWSVRPFYTCDRVPERHSAEARKRAQDSGTGQWQGVKLGHKGGNEFHAGSGNDLEKSGAGSDELHGGSGDDLELGGRGADTEYGGRGDDQLLSGRGSDLELGGRGSDELFDDHGHDELHGGPGPDRFSAHDGNRDEIRCGRGEDVVVADPKDSVGPDCEHVYRTRDEAPRHPPGN